MHEKSGTSRAVAEVLPACNVVTRTIRRSCVRMHGKIRAVIVDDEPFARERLQQLLSTEIDIEVVGEYQSGAAFLAALASDRPDLVFLDIELPLLSGIDVAESVRSAARPRPFVVFVTAFDTYAARAFDAEATDYVLKPFDRARFARTLNRVRRQLSGTRAAESPKRNHLTRLAVRNGGRIQLVPLDHVDWIEAAANYVRLHVGGRCTHLFRGSMAALEQRLDRSRFVRIHRSTIVNVERIAELQPTFERDQIVLMLDGTRLRMSASYRKSLESIVEGL